MIGRILKSSVRTIYSQDYSERKFASEILAGIFNYSEFNDMNGHLDYNHHICVDALIYRGARQFGRRIKTSHLFCNDEKLLHAFASKIGLSRVWCHTSKRGLLHYDLKEKYRKRAIENGATEISRKEMAIFFSKNYIFKLKCPFNPSKCPYLQ